MVCAMFILLWVNDELNYDTFYPNSKQLYRVTQEVVQDNGEVFKAVAAAAPLPELLKEQFPEVLEYARIVPIPTKSLLSHGEQKLYDHITYADSTFFKLFDLPITLGNKNNALQEPLSAVITEKLAGNLFGNDWRQKNVLGKVIKVNNNHEHKITGVIANIPENSHLKFDILLPLSNLRRYGWDMGWSNYLYNAYVKLKPVKNIDELANKMTTLLKKQGKEFANFNFHLQPVEDIHLYSDFDIDMYGSSEPQYTYVHIFLIVAIAILVLACINFVNLSTARSEKKAKEIGVRKTLGSKRSHIIYQLIGESLLITTISFCLAIAICILLLPTFNSTTGKNITLDMSAWPLLSYFTLGAVGVGLFAGTFPAYYLSGFQPVKAIKGTFGPDKVAVIFRRILVTFQFVIAIVLIIGTIVVYRQFNYFLQKDLGYQKEQVLYIPKQGNIKFETFKNSLSPHKEIKGIFHSSVTPLYTTSAGGDYTWEGKDPEINTLFYNQAVSFDYIDQMGIELTEGRNFSSQFSTDSSNYILNQEALDMTGLKDPIGKRFSLMGKEGKIIGITKNFNFKSLHYKIEPLVMSVNANEDRNFFVKIDNNNVEKAVGIITDTWKKLSPDYPLTYHFLDEEYEKLYSSEQRMANLFNYLTSFTLIVACLGLFGLINHMIEKRRKEISIRKVLGSSKFNILQLLSSEYLKLIILAIFIASPFAWWMMDMWLANFAYRVELSWWIFVIAGLTATIIALITTSVQTLKAADANPVRYLKEE